MYVGDIARTLNLAPSTVSHHLPPRGNVGSPTAIAGARFAERIFGQLAAFGRAGTAPSCRLQSRVAVRNLSQPQLLDETILQRLVGAFDAAFRGPTAVIH
jgi:DNA-binding transcriptional ArsR family regulator